MLKDGYIKSGNVKSWDSVIRRYLGIKEGVGISATRNFNYILPPIIEFDTNKLTDDFKVIPFSENIDFYIWFKKEYNKDISFDEIVKKYRYENDPKISKEYWRYKTDKNSFDFGIAEEVILTNKIPLNYIKKVYIDDFNDKELLNLLVENGIDFVKYENSLSKIKYSNKNKKLV